jgi:hypothetical protein
MGWSSRSASSWETLVTTLLQINASLHTDNGHSSKLANALAEIARLAA